MRAFITVVVPVRNEARFIEDTLGQLLSQYYATDSYEIIVADGMSDDGTREIVLNLAQNHPQIHLLDNPRRLSSAGRNVGFKNGHGDYFLVVDGHCYIPDKQLFKNVVDCFEKSGADCLGRPQPLDPPGLSDFQKAVALARASRLGHGGDSLIFGEYEGFASPVSNGAAYKREIFDNVGYVDESFDAAEDVEFNYRVEQAGLSCFTSPILTIRYYPRENLQCLFKQMVRYGRGRRKFTKKHRETLTLNQLIPAVFVIGLSIFLLTLILFAVTDITFPLLFAAVPFACYAVLLFYELFKVLLREGWQRAFQVPVIIFVIHFALGYGFLREIASE